MKKAGKKANPLSEPGAAELQNEMNQNEIKGPVEPPTLDKEGGAVTIPAPERARKTAADKSEPLPPAFIEENTVVKHQFTETEMSLLGQALAGHQTAKTELENTLKSISSDYRNKIKRIVLDIDGETSRIQQGYEMRPVQAFVLHNREQGFKCFYRKDTGEFIRKETMTEVDFQLLTPPWPKGHLSDAPYKPKAPKKSKGKKTESV
jgi:hypothetical protein